VRSLCVDLFCRLAASNCEHRCPDSAVVAAATRQTPTHIGQGSIQMKEFRPEEKNVVYIGEGVSLSGKVEAEDTVVVDGAVEGEISCSRLIVGPSGVVAGSISVSEADIYGKIGEDITVRGLLIVRSSGRVEGKWVYGEIEVERGGVLSGAAEATQVDAEAKPAPTRLPLGKPQVAAEIEEDEAPVQGGDRVASLTSRALLRRRRA
jgi:cytoskeletal protein CcmA (bactofilin family)